MPEIVAPNPPALIRDQEFVPVVLGGDRLGYSLARSFHMAYGYRTLVVSRMVAGPIAHSDLIVHQPIESLEDPQVLVRTLRELAPRVGSAKRLLLATTDHVVSVLARVKDQLEDLYLIPYADAELIDTMTRKENFAKFCAELNIPHPATVVYDVAGQQDSGALDHLTYPVIAKPSNAEAWAGVSFEGKRKVHTAASRTELDDLLGRLRAAGYTDKMILQDVIPGDDQNMRILTCYVARDGKVHFASYGRVLLEEHSPDTVGFPAAILTERDDAAIAQATRLLEQIGWRGYANFDMKFDPRTGETVFFELNPRLGGTSFYITAAGHNVVRWYVDEYVRGEDLSARPPVIAEDQHVFTAVPVKWLQRYITDPDTAATVKRLIRERKVTNPWFYSAERNPRRWAWIVANQANYIRKYRRYYPEPKALV
ncbi:carboxylate--amine ligase [Calidifontibacter sp. DB0510]|uniref:Carboxylate--amine ligase n=1 Tax=Metallococcus carri TaxID=1656884 RepID=A0A967B4P8_9MICO|nr:carboxylate--amine ligase [Metallococcus carri]NHN54581.1 carboxylate--amine ligase [Metallococcus carri]NOP36580.1 carboxylate--amine ligase [Calidifontibacter sp. DB2511S]